MTEPAKHPTMGLPHVQGRCPACGWSTLFLGDGGYVTCSIAECPEPDAASRLLERPAQPETCGSGVVCTPRTRCADHAEEQPRHAGHAGATRTTSPTRGGDPVQGHAGTAHGHTAVRDREQKPLVDALDDHAAEIAEAAVRAAYTLANHWAEHGKRRAAMELRAVLDRTRTTNNTEETL